MGHTSHLLHAISQSSLIQADLDAKYVGKCSSWLGSYFLDYEGRQEHLVDSWPFSQEYKDTKISYSYSLSLPPWPFNICLLVLAITKCYSKNEQKQ